MPFERDRTAHWYSKLWQSLTNVAIVIGLVIVTTVAMLLLYIYRCYKVRITSITLNITTHRVSVSKYTARDLGFCIVHSTPLIAVPSSNKTLVEWYILLTCNDDSFVVLTALL